MIIKACDREDINMSMEMGAINIWHVEGSDDMRVGKARSPQVAILYGTWGDLIIFELLR